MKKTIIFTLTIIALSLITNAQISVVVGAGSSQTADESTAKNMFSMVKTSWADGSKVVIADQGNTQTGKDFYSGFMGTTTSKIRAKQAKAYLSGKSSKPINCSTDEDVKKAVAGNPNAIGYIHSASVDETVKVLFKIK